MNADIVTRDLTRFRSIFATYVLLTLPTYSWVADYPNVMWIAPPGPLMLIGGPPPAWVLTGLQVGVALTMGALLIGRWVVASSVLATLLLATGSGITYGFGKIDHDILLVLTPAVMAGVGWSGRRQPNAVAMRLWAFAMGLSMLSAGIVKVMVGWLDTSTHAVHAALTVFTYLDDRHGPLAEVGLTSIPKVGWELLDWATVLLECGVVLSVLSWTWFRRSLAVLCIFHLAVGLTFGIIFAGNVVVYGAFVRWSRARTWPSVSSWVALPIVAGALGIRALFDPAVLFGPLALAGGAAIAAAYLLRSVRMPTLISES